MERCRAVHAFLGEPDLVSTQRTLAAVSKNRAIHVALPGRGLNDGAYRGLLRERFDVDTCKALTRRQASDLLATLGQALPRPPGARRSRTRKPAPTGPNVRRMVSPAQRELINELAGEIGWREPDGFLHWLRHNQGLERVSTSDQAARASSRV